MRRARKGIAVVRLSRWLVLGGSVAVFFLGAGVASAESHKCGHSAVDQYTECIPTSGGSTPTGGSHGGAGGSGGGQTGGGTSGGGIVQSSATGGAGSSPLSVPVSRALAKRGGSDTQLLRRLATSPRYGAPSGSPAKGASAGGRTDGGAGSDPSAGGAFSAAASAVTGGDGGRVVGIVAAAVIVSLVALAAAGIRQRRLRA